jgi:hypothetical protein
VDCCAFQSATFWIAMRPDCAHSHSHYRAAAIPSAICGLALAPAAPVRVRSWGLTGSKVAVAGRLFFCPPMTGADLLSVASF